MRLVWVVIPLVLIGIVGISESYGYGGGSKPDPCVCGDRLCSEIIDDQKPSSDYVLGKLQWTEISYPLNSEGIIRIIDSDMNFDSSVVEIFEIDVWSDSDSQGIELFVIETEKSSGVFEGKVLFTIDDSSKNQLHVTNGDTISAHYTETTLPGSYFPQTELEILDVTIVGTFVPPIGRPIATNLRIVDMFGNSLDSVNLHQPMYVSSDIANGQDREQSFVYFIQIQDGNGFMVHLDWVEGNLNAGQSFSPMVSWIPNTLGVYTAIAFKWDSIDDQNILSPPISTTINVVGLR